MTKRLLSLVLAVMMVVSMSTFCATAVNEVPADIIEAAGKDGVDEGAVITLFDEPVTTTFGTMANVLPEGGYTFQTDGQYGLTLIFKFEGTKPGTVFGKLNPTVIRMVEKEQAVVDPETGEETGETETVKVEEKRSPIWNANWINDGYQTNSTVLSGDGIYFYYFPFKNVENAWTNAPSVAGETKVEIFNVFHQYGSLGDNRAAQVVADETMSVTCLGVMEGNITEHNIYAYDKLADTYTPVTSPLKINGASNSNYAQWRKVPDLSDTFGVDFGAVENEYITGWVDRNGEAVEETDFAVKVVEPVYDSYAAEDLIEVTFLDAEGEELTVVKGLKGQGLIGDVPANPEKASDGVCTYVFENWTIDGAAVEPASYKYTSDTTVVPAYKSYGKILESEPVAINKPDENGVIAQQDVLTEDVMLDPGSHGVTVVYKAEGITEDIIADNLMVALNNKKNGAYQYDDANYSSHDFTANQFTIRNGYYFMYFNQNINGTNGVTPEKMHAFMLFFPYAEHFAETGRTAVNNNENATIQIVAITSDNLQPTVTFHGTDGEVLTTYTHKYTDVHSNLGYGTGAGQNPSFQTGSLLTMDEVFALTGAEQPVKVSGVAEVTYEFDGWMDAEGKKLDVLMLSGDVYPIFKVTDLRTKYNVEFQNYDGTVLYSTVVPEEVTPEYVGANPEKPSTDTNSFVFNGWTPDLAPMPATSAADGATAAEKVVYTAKYETVERRYDVTYYAEDGVTVLDKDMYIIKGEASSTDVVPTKEADVQYTYTFDKWVDLDGNAVNLESVTADMSVKPTFKGTLNKYTVYFYDEDGSELGKSTVDYGTAATAPEATKEATQWYTYTFDKWVYEDGTVADITSVKGDMFVYATYADEFLSPYPDEEPWPTWAQDAIEYVLIEGVMNGMDGGFQPDTTMSRAMVVTVLHRYMGTPETEIPETFANFTDNLDTESWYYDAVIWGAVNGIVNGRGNGIFDPNGNVTRQEFAAILYRFSDEVMGEYMGYGRSSLSVFYDREDIASWAHTPVKWAYATAADTDTQGSTAYNKSQYITGAGIKDGKVIFNPKANATRAQVATMLYRYMTGERIPAK